MAIINKAEISKYLDLLTLALGEVVLRMLEPYRGANGHLASELDFRKRNYFH